MLFRNLVFACAVFTLLLSGSCTNTSTESSSESAVTTDGTVDILLHYGKANERTISDLPWAKGMTVWQAMVLAEDKGELKIGFRDYTGMGKFIHSLDDVEQSENAGIYWRLCINNVNSTLGVEKQTVRKGQTIEWFLARESPCDKAGS